MRMVPGRDCDGCSMCCKLFDVPEIAKPAGAWCGNIDAARRLCAIYETRPGSCSAFYCHYRIDSDVPEHWKPNRCHMVVKAEATGQRITVTVDPQRPNAWRERPYYQDLKMWSANRLQAGKQLHVRIGGRTIVVLPDRDVDLGEVGDRTILTRETPNPRGGITLDFEVVERDDPRAKAAQEAQAARPAPLAIFRR